MNLSCSYVKWYLPGSQYCKVHVHVLRSPGCSWSSRDPAAAAHARGAGLSMGSNWNTEDHTVFLQMNMKLIKTVSEWSSLCFHMYCSSLWLMKESAIESIFLTVSLDLVGQCSKTKNWRSFWLELWWDTELRDSCNTVWQRMLG